MTCTRRLGLRRRWGLRCGEGTTEVARVVEGAGRIKRDVRAADRAARRLSKRHGGVWQANRRRWPQQNHYGHGCRPMWLPIPQCHRLAFVVALLTGFTPYRCRAARLGSDTQPTWVPGLIPQRRQETRGRSVRHLRLVLAPLALYAAPAIAAVIAISQQLSAAPILTS